MLESSFQSGESNGPAKRQTQAMMKRIIIVLALFAAFSEISPCYLPTKKPGSACDDLQKYLVDRKGWCAEEPSMPMQCMWGPVVYVIVHHTVTGSCSSGESCAESMRKMQKEHMTEKSWPDIGYHYVIGGDGKAYAGRPCNKMGGHTKNHNRKSIGIALLGNFEKESPSIDMLDLIPKIAYCGVEKGYIHPNFLVIGHRDAYCSSCPGDALYEVIKNWPRYPDKVPIPSFTCDTKVPDTTEMVTTTEATTTTTAATTTTTEATTTVVDKPESFQIVLPVYFLWLSKKPISCCPK